MPDLVLRVSAQRFDVDSFLARHRELKTTLVWREGEVERVRGSTLEHSGFNLPLVDEDDRPKLVARLRGALSSIEPALAELLAYGADLKLDAGVFATADRAVVSFSLEPDELALLARLGITFKVSVYPCSD